MPTIRIENVPADLHRRLAKRAAQHQRSLDHEVLAMLEEATREPHRIPPVTPHKTKHPLTQDWLDQARREGRE